MALRAAIAFSAAGVAVLVLGAVLRSLARRRHRQWPRRSGGVVLVVAVPVGLVAATSIPTRALFVAGGALAMAAFGLVRDRAAVPRWAVPVVMVGISTAVAAGGLRFPLGGVPAVDFVWTVVWLTLVTTAIANSGNADGQLPSLLGASTLGIVALAAFARQSALATLSAALLGGLVGFLAYNLRPASLYMGRAGASFGGFMVAAGALWVHPSIGRPESLLVRVLLVAVPLVDGLVVVYSRLRRRRRLTVRIRDHLAHRLVAIGLRPSRTIVLLALVQLACSLIAVFAGRGVLSVGIAAAVAGALLLALAVAALRARMRDEATPGFSWRVRLLVFGVVAFAVAASVVAAASAFSSRTKLLAARDTAQAAIRAASDGNSSRAVELFALAERDFAAAQDRLGSVVNVPSLVVPVVGANMHAARQLTRVGLDLSRAGRELATVVNSDDLRFVDGRVPLDQVFLVAPELDEASRVLVRSRSSIDALDTGFLVSEMKDGVGELRRELSTAERDATSAAAAARIAPRILGDGTPRRYLLLVQNPAELRGTGGLIGNWGILSAADGKVRLDSLERIGALNAAGNPAARTLNAPDDYVERYARFQPARSLQNANISPDFPTVSAVLADQYAQATGESVDGVVAVDPIGLAALLELTGPVRVPDWPTPINAQNVVDVTLRDAYSAFARTPERADFLGDVARAAIDDATSGDLGSLERLSRVLSKAANEGHIALWFRAPDEERIVDDIEVSGRMPRSRGDMLHVSNTNAGANKLDYYLGRAIDYAAMVTPSPDLRKAFVEGTATVSLANDVPESGLPQIAAGPYEGATDLFVYGQNHTFVSVYSPLTHARSRLDAAVLEPEVARELGHNVVSSYVDVFAQGSATMSVDLEGLVSLGRGGWYELTLVRQPTLRPDRVTVRIEVPDGFEIRRAPGLEVVDGVAQGTIDLVRNRTVRVKIGAGDGASLWDRLEAGG